MTDSLVHHMLRTSAARAPEKEALVWKDERLTFVDLAGRVRALAHGLQRAGLEPGDRVGVFARPSSMQVAGILGVSRAGGVFVPVHHSLLARQLRHIVHDCGMKGLIVDPAGIRQVLEIVGDDCPLEFLVVAGKERVEDTPVRSLEYGDLIAAAGDPPHEHSASGTDLAAILYTSGSTGPPKGVMLSHRNLLAGASIVSEYLEITAEDRTLAVLPFSFDAGLNQLMTAIQQGATLVLQDFLLPEDVVRTLEDEHITGLAGVPTFWALMARGAGRLAGRALESLRYITNTGGALPPTVLEALRSALPETRIYLMYGLTEAFRSTYLPPEELDRRPTSIGKAIPQTEILVVDDGGQPCGPGEVGELVHIGPTVSMGYWNEPELTALVLRPDPRAGPGAGDDQRVCYSGDLVRSDDDGFLYFVGRRDNLIKSMGFRVSPTEVEAILCASDAVHEAAVIGVPDEFRGHRIRAFVTLAEGTGAAPEALVAFCAGESPPHMVPDHIEIVAALPRTTTGKVDYAALRVRSDREAGSL